MNQERFEMLDRYIERLMAEFPMAEGRLHELQNMLWVFANVPGEA